MVNIISAIIRTHVYLKLNPVWWFLVEWNVSEDFIDGHLGPILISYHRKKRKEKSKPRKTKLRIIR